MQSRMRRRNTSRLTPGLREQFDALLLTWQVQQARGKVPRAVQPGTPDWELKCEGRWGIGYYTARKHKLEEGLSTAEYLNEKGRVDFPALLAALMWGKQQQWLDALRAGERDRARWWHRESRLIFENVDEWVSRLQHFFQRTGYANHENWPNAEVPKVVTLAAEFRQAIREVKRKESRLEMLTRPWLKDSELCLGHAGQPRKTWMPELRRRLTAAGIPAIHQSPFFVAAGLSPYRK